MTEAIATFKKPVQYYVGQVLDSIRSGEQNPLDIHINRVKIEKPEGYNPEDYELGARYFEAEPKAWPLIISRMPNGKTDINNRAAFSTDFIGGMA